MFFENIHDEKKTLDKITDLVEQKICEDFSLEYKEDLKINTTSERKEFLCDLTQFANAKGGNIIYGIQEEKENNKNTGRPIKINGISINNKDEIDKTITNLTISAINPRIIGLDWKPIQINNSDKYILIFKIPASWIGPHIVSIDKSTLFYTRLGTSKHQMDSHEIRSSFLRALGSEERISHFRENRVAEIISGKSPVTINNKPSIILHIYPLSSITSDNYIDISLFPNEKNRNDETLLNFFNTNPGYKTGDNLGIIEKYYNYEGFLICSLPEDEYRGFIQIYRNGIIEYLYILKNNLLELKD